MINLNILQFTKSYCLMLIVMSIVGIGSFSACKKNIKVDSTQNPDDSNTPKFTLKITKTGKGSVSASWYGTSSYGQATDAQLTTGVKITKDATVSLYATPDASMPYVTWNNIIAKNRLSIDMTIDQEVSVSFSATPLITHALTMNVNNNNDTSLKAYADQDYTIPITDISKIVANQKVYLKLISNKIITSITGIDPNSLSKDKKTATITMDADKTITATLDIDLTGFVFTETATTATLIKYTGKYNIIEIPSTYNGKPVTAINSSYQYNNLFGNAGMLNVIIPNTVTSIGDYAFFNCMYLTNITLPNTLKSIGKNAFLACSKLTTLAIPNSVTSIGDYAFNGCTGLTSISIGNGVTSSNIGSNTFTSCGNVTTINIGSGLTNLFGLRVNDYQKLIDIHVDANNPRYASIDGVLFSKAKDTLVRYPKGKAGTSYTIPNSVTSIGNNAFNGCSELTSMTIPNSVTSIGDYGYKDYRNGAFDGCNKIETLYWDADISIMYLNSESYFETPKNYFQDSKSTLKNIFFGYHATKIQGSDFGGFTNIENVDFDKKNIFFQFF